MQPIKYTEEQIKDNFIELLIRINGLLQLDGHDFKISVSENSPRLLFPYLKGLNSNQKTIVLEVLLVNFWKDKETWSYDPNSPLITGQTMDIAFDILPINKISLNIQGFIIENLRALIQRAESDYINDRNMFSYHIDFPAGDIELIKYIIPYIDTKLLSQSNKETLISTQKEVIKNDTPEAIKCQIDWLIDDLNQQELFTKNYDSWARLANIKLQNSCNEDKLEIKSTLSFTNKLYSTKKEPDHKWITLSKNICANNTINFILIYEYLALTVLKPETAEWYWGGKSENFKPSFVISNENTKILKPLIWLFSFCNDDNLLFKLCELIPALSEKKVASDPDVLVSEQKYCISLSLARAIVWAIINNTSINNTELIRNIKDRVENKAMLTYIRSTIKNSVVKSS